MKTELKKAQRNDRECQTIIEYLEREKLPEKEDVARRVVIEARAFEVINGILYRKIVNNRRQELKLVIPESMRDAVIQNTS